jgi:hypothetical protein
MKKLQILTLSMLVATGYTIQSTGPTIVPPTETSVTAALNGSITLQTLQGYAPQLSSAVAALTSSSIGAAFEPIVQEARNIDFAFRQLMTPTVASVTLALGSLTIASLQMYVTQFMQDLNNLNSSSTVAAYQNVQSEIMNINFALQQLVPKPAGK